MAEPTGDTTTDPPAADADAPVDRTFTPADVERIVKERLARAKIDPPADYDDLKAKAARLADLESANQSELEKAQARADEAEKRAQQIEADAREIGLRAAIIAEAAKPGRNVVDTADVIALLDRSTLELDNAGNPTNIAVAMDSLLAAKPHLVTQHSGGTRGSADQGARGGGPQQLTREQLKTMSPEAIVKAEEEGRLTHLLSGQT